MAWMTIRRATAEDVEKMNAAATRFAERHTLRCSTSPLYGAAATAADVEDELACHPRGAYLRHLWRAIVRRALGSDMADGIAYGYVGYYVD